jgi:hypothetical protein
MLQLVCARLNTNTNSRTLEVWGTRTRIGKVPRWGELGSVSRKTTWAPAKVSPGEIDCGAASYDTIWLT